MTHAFQRFTKRYAAVLGVLIGMSVISSALLYSGCGMTSSPSIPVNPTPTPDTVRPNSIITSPTAGGLVSTSSTVNITGTASDAGGGTVQSVEVSVDGGVTWNQATGTTAWSFAWSPTLSGAAIIRSRAIDSSGNQQDPPAQVIVTVQDKTPPTSTITSPTAGTTVIAGTTFTITGTGSDIGAGMKSVEVSVDGGATWNPATGTLAWVFFWFPTQAGPATIKSRAIDNSGNQQDPPAEVSVTVIDPNPPTVSPRFPAAGETDVGATMVLSAFFSEQMDPATVNESTVEVLAPSDVPVPAVVNYNPSNRIVFLDPIEPLATGTTYTLRVRGGDTEPRVKDLAGNSMAADETWTFTTGLPPRVLSTTPANGATDVLIGVAPRVRFSKEPGLIFHAAVLLEDSEGNSVPFDVSFPSSDFTVAILPIGLLQPLKTYTLTLKGGPNEPHITDRNGTPLESDVQVTFTTAAAPPPIPTFSVFAPTVTPANPVSDDSLATEVGMKFRSDGDGFITGVRHYNGGPENAGVLVGKLWASDGTLLGSRPFLFSTEVGWRQRLFQTPIPINADTTYVVSYFAPQGHYADDPGFFASSGVDNGPLHALRDGVDGGNGVFLRSPTGGFPTDTSMSSNYYVDVVFSPRISPPQVLSTTPGPGSILLLPGQGQPVTLTFTFTEAIDPASVNESTVLLTDTANNPVPFTISVGAGNFTVTLTFQQRPQIAQAYTVTLKGGDGEPHITNAAGTPLVADYTWSFTADLLLAPAFTEETMIGNRIKAGADWPEKQLARIPGLNHAPSELFR